MTDEEERAPRKQGCTWHCAACGAHFHSVSAFDDHRVDGECVDPAEVMTRGTIDNPPHAKLQAWTEEGYCRLAKGCYKDGVLVQTLHPVTIYQTAGSAFRGFAGAAEGQLALC